MLLHEGEKYRCEDCNAQVAVVRSSDTRSLDFDLPRTTTSDANAYSQNPANDQFRLYCCGKGMVRFCMTAAS
jgi:hypothetical protein